MHALLRENVSSKDLSRRINLISHSAASPYDSSSDKAISTVMKDLGSHLTTLNTNLKQMKEVRAWVNRAEESLSEVLRRFEGEQSVNLVRGAQVL